MKERSLFLALPDELYADADAIAQQRGISMTDFFVKTLVDAVEAHRRSITRDMDRPPPNGHGEPKFEES